MVTCERLLPRGEKDTQLVLCKLGAWAFTHELACLHIAVSHREILLLEQLFCSCGILHFLVRRAELLVGGDGHTVLGARRATLEVRSRVILMVVKHVPRALMSLD